MTECYTCGLEKATDDYDHDRYGSEPLGRKWVSSRSKYGLETMCPPCVKVLVRLTNGKLRSWCVSDDGIKDIHSISYKDGAWLIKNLTISYILKYRVLVEEFEQFVDGDWVS